MDAVGTRFAVNYTERFQWSEYLVFAALLISSMAIGVFYGFFSKKNQTNEQFLMAGRSMPVFPVTLSVLCSFVSAITLLGNPVEVYFYGLQYCVTMVSFVWMSFMLAYIYVPVYFNLQLTSAFEYFELRFNRKVRTVISVSQIIHGILYMPTTVLGPAIALEAVAGIDAILTSSIIFLVCIAYSSIGGLKAVLWTDALQAFVMIAALIAVIVAGVSDIGGLDVVWKRSEATGRTNILNFDIDPRTRHTFWTGSIAAYFSWTPLFAATQAQIQRYLSVPTLTKARQVIFINMFGLIAVVSLCSFTGLVIYAKYYDCDPIQFTEKFPTSDQLLPLFVMDVIGNTPVIPGLFVAGLTAGSLSSVSSTLNALAAIITEDFVKQARPNLSDIRLGHISKVVSTVEGLIAFALVFVIAEVGNILPFVSVIHGTFLGPIFGCFTLGMFFPWTNWLGILLAIIPSVGFTLFVGLGSILAGIDKKLPNQKLYHDNSGCYLNETISTVFAQTDWKNKEFTPLVRLFSLSYQWQPFIPVVCTVVFGIIFSLIVAQFQKYPPTKEKYISAPILKFWKAMLGRNFVGRYVEFEDLDEKKEIQNQIATETTEHSNNNGNIFVMSTK